MTRVAASVIILALLSPALATIACDVVCSLAADQTTMDMTTCHGHHADDDGPAIVATNNGPCHSDADSPLAVLAGSLQWVATVAPRTTHAMAADERGAARRNPIPASRGSTSPPLVSPLRI